MAREMTMDEGEFEGKLVLEQLAAIDKVDEFLEAVDADDIGQAIRLMKHAGVDAPTISKVVKMMEEGDSEH
jgi:hypothetical protein